jgi:hypothetical protein
MYLHIGNGCMLRQRDISAIYDAGLFQGGDKTAQQNCRTLAPLGLRAATLAANARIRSVIVTDTQVWYSEISSLTLQRRWQQPWRD